MDPVVVSFLFGVVAALCGQTPFLATQVLGTLTSLTWLGFLVYVAFAYSFGTAGLAFLSGFGGAVVGTGAAKLIVIPALVYLARRD